jgi:transcriptional regulator with XRE-family HTH domain
MATKSQHAPAYAPLPAFLRTLREEAKLTQRELGHALGKPQSWIHNCEVGNRRVDVAEFAAWATVCGVKPTVALQRFLSEAATLPGSRRGTRQPNSAG